MYSFPYDFFFVMEFYENMKVFLIRTFYFDDSMMFAANLEHHNCEHNLSFSRSSLASYILGLDEDSTKSRKHVEEMFSSLFSALLDALLSRAQVYSVYFSCYIVIMD